MTAAYDVRPPPRRPVAPRISRAPSEPLPTVPTPDAPPWSSSSPREDALVAELSRLASQHHASEYSRLKFGPNGSPLAYVPYSVQMPDHYREMQAHQLRCAQHKAWWPHNRTIPAVPKRRTIVTANLREQLAAAMESPIILPRTYDRNVSPAHGSQPRWQTSETHPIVISTIIPSELLPALSLHASRSAQRFPVILTVPGTHHLDRLIPVPVAPAPQKVAPPPPIGITPRSPPLPPVTVAITKAFKLSSIFWVHPTVKRAFMGGADPSVQDTRQRRARPVSFIAPSSARSDRDLQEVVCPIRKKSVLKSAPPSPHDLRKELDTDASRTYSKTAFLSAVPSPSVPVISVQVPAVPVIPPVAAAMLGNLYMSSCPGKKVRLDGPVRGRNTVCRDLPSDLTRIKGVGVSCIVCCLDDLELQSLGVHWADYVRAADELDMDILRLPTPEGLAPLDPTALDAHLTRLIDDYTLRGSAILVHCRGGIGRAGIIACCWMLKLGLLGWPSSATQTSAPRETVNPDTMHLVERVISVVRRRRSPKAVETYEQVRFLVDYIEFLRSQGATRNPYCMDLFADWDTHVE
ncbi:phosphatases II [Epithele typhae]|uniref:phosphatases II n=1 Tax=Epithele typhae TaxID=378194 RepID=UPI002007663C|nr:phosphatases II [Epithele typhae]KAH9940524.1 phosphatases II [Epithele typhae]